MKKIKIYGTYDVFNYDDEELRRKLYSFCNDVALKCGLICNCEIGDRYPELRLFGTKYQFLKYYVSMLSSSMYRSNRFNVLKRLLSVIKW